MAQGRSQRIRNLGICSCKEECSLSRTQESYWRKQPIYVSQWAQSRCPLSFSRINAWPARSILSFNLVPKVNYYRYGPEHWRVGVHSSVHSIFFQDEFLSKGPEPLCIRNCLTQNKTSAAWRGMLLEYYLLLIRYPGWIGQTEDTEQSLLPRAPIQRTGHWNDFDFWWSTRINSNPQPFAN